MGTIRTRNRRSTKDNPLSWGGSISTLVIILILNVCQLSRGNPVFVDNPSLAQFQSGRNIRHLPCIVRKSGMSGVCMFAIDCIKQNGTHLGTCIDRFYFGSCCQMKDDSKIFAEEIVDNSIDQNTISHFSHETSTLSTSSVFKLPTESYIDSLGIRNHSTIHPYIPVSTITHMAAKVESTTSRFITSRPTTTTTTTTTTTPAPTTTTRRTTAEPSRRRTTTAAPLLTKAPETTFEDIFDSTTMPAKFTTFQMVETSTPNRPTEPTVHEETTTFRRPVSSRRPTTTPPRTKRPVITRIPAANFTVSPTTTRPTSRTTPKYKPTQSKRPTTTTTTTTPKPTKRPVVVTTTTATRTRPTRKPVVHHEAANITTSAPTRNDPELATSTLKPNVTSESTTRAPRPRPKPTAEIFKITRPPLTAEVTTIKLEPPMTTTTTTTTKPRPSPTTTTTMTSTTTPVPTTTTTTTQRTTTTRAPIRRPTTTTTSTTTPAPTTTTTTTTTPAPTTTTTTTTTAAPTTKTTTTTTPAPTTTTTTTPVPTTTSTTTSTTSSTTTTTTARPTPQRPTTTEFIPDATSTYRPTLVTWTTVVDNKPNKTQQGTGEDTDWQPKPPPAGWVPVPTIDPEVVANKTSPSTTETSSSPLGPTTEGVMLASSSEAEKVDLVESTTSGLPLNATSTPLSTLTTEGPAPAAATTTTTPRPSPSPTPTSTTITTESTSEAFLETSTIEQTTITLPEELNVTTPAPFTTTSPIPSLEGVDYKQICGRRMFPEPRIVGGSNAAFGRWPWQISLRQWRTSTYLHKCGAALLNENWAITAAHCVDNVPPSDLLLRLGEYDLAEEEEPYGYQERRVQIVASHPQFDPRTFEYDLALLRFYEPVVFQPNIIPVCVPGSDEDFIGQTAFVTGWGRLYEDGPLPSVLQEVAVPIINNTICETMYRAAGYIEHIPHIFICAGWKKGGYDSCEGDSGGPMVLQREADKRFILGGVISWGIGCAEPNQPGVYTRISEFRDWVNQILQF